MTKITTDIIPQSQRQQFIDEGYMLLPKVLSDTQLELLRSRCQAMMDHFDAEMEAQGVDRLGINHKGKRYFANKCYERYPELGEFIFSDLMAEVCKATIGENAYLFWDQYVVKGPDKSTSFSWHQDSGYVHMDSPEYVTCWVTLDDVTIENGSVYLLPYSEAGIRSVVKHIPDPETNDKVGYFGKNPGIPVELPAGSIACFSSYVFHRSGPNLTQNLRRVFLPQYTPDRIEKPDGSGELFGQHIPFMENGKIVWNQS